MLRKSVGIGLLTLGLSGYFGGISMQHYYGQKQANLPKEVHRVYEIRGELDKPITARKILESRTIEHYETLQKELKYLMSQEEVTKNVNAYERYDKYRGYIPIVVIPSILMTLAGMITLPSFPFIKIKKN